MRLCYREAKLNFPDEHFTSNPPPDSKAGAEVIEQPIVELSDAALKPKRGGWTKAKKEVPKDRPTDKPYEGEHGWEVEPSDFLIWRYARAVQPHQCCYYMW